jgi:hypothetical protein
VTVMKEMQYPVSVRWRGGRLAHADADGKASLEVGYPAGVPGRPDRLLEP